jgi:SAM-dependent methyltransferase
MASPVRKGLKSERATGEYGVVVCGKCRSCAWEMETGNILRCQSCHAGVPIENGILDFLGVDSPDSLSPVVKQWDAHYGGCSKPYSEKEDWWTLSCWEKHLFGGVTKNWTNKLIADFGCGTGSRIAAIAPIDKHAYRYVGIDSSFEALNCAANNLPNGLFIRANVGSPCLRPAVADVVLCLGVLMYVQDYLNVLDHLLRALKPGGLLLIHEQVSRVSWGRIANLVLGIEPDRSPGGHGVHWRGLRDNLVKQGRVLHVHLGGSPFRSPLRKLVRAIHLDTLNPIVAGLDSVWCCSVGRALPAMGPAEVQIVFQKA